MSYYNTCPHCGAHLDPGEACDCKQAMIDEIMDLYREMNHEQKQEFVAYCREIVAKREAAQGATNTQDGKVEQIDEPVSVTILTAPKEVVNHDC